MKIIGAPIILLVLGWFAKNMFLAWLNDDEERPATTVYAKDDTDYRLRKAEHERALAIMARAREEMRKEAAREEFVNKTIEKLL